MFPSYVLANLFVKGSLKNHANGFSLKLKNSIDSGTVTGFGPLTVGENSYPPENIKLKIKDREVIADQLSSSAPVSVYVLAEIEIIVEGEQLSPGEHQIGFLIHTREAGRLQFSIKEMLSE